MAGNNQAIRGARVGYGSVGELDHGVRVERIGISYWDAEGNETVRYYAADIDPADIPEEIDSPKTGLPAGRDKDNPPIAVKNEPYKTHLAYVKERRTEAEAEQLLEEALQRLRDRRGLAMKQNKT
ncbi:RNA polymerase-binding protein RbpA [Canibacter sp. lx-72]|uniref:RNA polymerase-binding protein RbpA n=1 Tax=Canibacter zhuwentaonis TaxID=2837491 RepID=UPI001BDC884A|nr:RNA polymerase-binding protein RbpA [Canibacter zhuwentaonis]MBT1018500.1 RNA polymerase-binding protein RbpA [Canibacter zhuwentaonis]MBT1035659.1 RNA polymerase-binding protein RbpA [Canibacter zhuwentaonis]